MAHSTLGPSSAKRWINCPGSVALAAMAPAPPSSIYAAEGTVAHSLAEEFVTGKIDSLDLMGKLGQIIHTSDGFDIEVSEDMIDGAIEYHDLIMGDRARMDLYSRHAGSVVGKAELRVGAPSIDDRLWGTSDYILYRKGHKLIVYDYKFGKGVVEADENEQMALYALAAMETEAGSAFNEIEVVICQPRAAHIDGTIRRWVAPPDWLREFAETARRAAVETRSPDAKIVAGGWCRSTFCPVIAICPAMHRAAQASAMVVFSDAAPLNGAAKTEARLPDVRLMSDAQLVKAFEWEETVNSFFEAVKAVLGERLSSGLSVSGIKLVEGRSNRVWTSEADVEAKFSPVLGEKLWERKILSPAKLEKIVGKKAGVDELTFKPEGKKTVALDRDPRREARSSAQDAFGGATALPTPLSDFDELMGIGAEESAASTQKRDPIWPV